MTRSSSASTVGIATHEAILTAAVMERPHEVLATSTGDKALVVLEEVEVGIGRPDLILLSVDLRVLTLRATAGLRLATLTDAQVLGAMLLDDRSNSGISRGHFRRVANRLSALGWLDRFAPSRGIDDSLLIEAKVSHWGKGVHQLSRVRWASHAAALLVPDDLSVQVPPAMLAHNRIGLLTQTGGRLIWRTTSPREPLPLHIDAWLGELAIRALTA